MSELEHGVWSVAAHHPQSVIAMLADYLLFDHHLYVTSLGKQPRLMWKLPKFCKVTFTAEGNVLVYNAGSRLMKYNLKGQMLWERQGKHAVTYTTTTTDNKIIVCGDAMLSVHDQNGWWLSSFPRDTATLSDPRGICTDSQGHVFVADCEKRAVLLYTSDGTYVREIVRMDERPGRLAMYQDRYLAVVGWEKPKLHVYDIKITM